MSLISLLIALLSERYLSKKLWQFDTYFKQYSRLFLKEKIVGESYLSSLVVVLFISLPVIFCFLILELIGEGFIYLLLSTVILIICFGCVRTRRFYKNYLNSAFQGEMKKCEKLHNKLLEDKYLPEMSVGQALVWLNYRYFIATMIFFVVFGAPGALFYRLLTGVNERCITIEKDDKSIRCFSHTVLFVIDWIPVRLIALAYMLVGHFSKAIPMWLENLFDINKPSYEVLTSVAQKSEDFMIDTHDCTAEPCILVRLAKRTLLLCLAVISVLILTGIL